MMRTAPDDAGSRRRWPARMLGTVAWLLPAADALALDWDYEGVLYATEASERQWLNIYQTQRADPAPIFLYAHANGSTADAMPRASAELITRAGFTLVSWESVADIRDAADTAVGAADAALVLSWIREHAAVYRLDPDRIIIGGRSRGSGISWIQAHSGHPAVLGLYFYNALPDDFWQELKVCDPVAEVTADSPPMHLAYGPSPADDDPHSPTNAYPIIERYEELGIGDRITLTDDMEATGLDTFHHFPALAARIAPPAPKRPGSGTHANVQGRGCSAVLCRAPGWWALALVALLAGGRRAFSRAEAVG